ncbi:MAG: hypothetical protein SA339_05390 [Methanomassiliicoccus sp.]|nr:hypothetical protein [Methanomassiliicoccus sp.]
MPHVVLTGVVALEDIFQELKPLLIKNDKDILRTMDVYLGRGNNSILIESLAIEGGRKATFLTLITSRDDGIVVRLYPKFEVEKTEGVKRILAEQAKQLLWTFPGLKVGETNLAQYLG